MKSNRVENSSSYEKNARRNRCLFSNHLYEKLKGVIKGGIFVKVNENDSLVVEIKRKDGNNFGVSFTDFSNRILNGFTTEYAVYEVTRKYRKYVMEQFFK